MTAISQIKSLGGGVGDRGGWGHLDSKSSTVLSVGNPDWHNSQGGLPLQSVCTYTVLLITLRGHTGYKMYPRGLNSSEKATYKSRPGHLRSLKCLYSVSG